MQAQQLSAVLVRRGLLQENQAAATLQTASSQQIPFLSLLIRQRLVDTRKLAEVIADTFACPLLDIDAVDLDALIRNTKESTDTGHLALLAEHRVIPLRLQGSVLMLVMADPASIGTLSKLDALRHLILQPVIADAAKLDSALQSLRQHLTAQSHDARRVSAAIELVVLNDETPDDAATGAETGSSDEAPVVRYVNQILLDAVRMQASDIHIEPFESWCRIRYRIDGILREGARAPAKSAARLCSRLKVMAALDITERRRPQDGRIRLRKANTGFVDLRISTLPTLWGEKIVLRVLDSHSALMTLDQLGCSAQQKRVYQQSLDSHQGMILVTGPTGSGKTVTLYSGLSHLNAGERNIATAEDPVEINLEGINQVAVNRRSGLDFATALRAFLRQDPDVVMLGEIRDQETADIAVKAAQTGHLVLSTLHTNSAADTVVRLLNMGVEAYNLASALSLIISQRLLRRLCDHCSFWSDIQPHEATAWLSAQAQAPARLRHAAGCRHCQDGYKGRLALMEMLPVTPEVRHLICQQSDVSELQRAAQAAGWQSLYESALIKVKDGETSLQEVRRVLT